MAVPSIFPGGEGGAREEPLTTTFYLGYYGFWIWCWFLLGYYLIWVPRKFARRVGGDISRIHYIASGWVMLVWMLYPVCWGVSEGGNVIPPDSEFIFYGILDCHLIPITSAFFLAAHWRIDPGRLGLRMPTYDDPLNPHDAVVEKNGDTRNGHTRDGVMTTEEGATSTNPPV